MNWWSTRKGPFSNPIYCITINRNKRKTTATKFSMKTFNILQDQWDTHQDNDPPIPPKGKKTLGDDGKGKYSRKMEEGLDKTKTAATNGMRKVKTGAVLSVRWIKDKCHRNTQKN
ncbi:hypothetical protein FEM48_Zijuj10G0063200 [Ziziphus jujuba var. spinosa]|uniref:Uncharacterized protein n=1 Tax=Ziziphus jujuba var. spinosa TaxID=714518 RepID=A0A978ULT2_ZIZJJ|nr:hypothetical protein FEM48_Zijuj10G0063200 [Ziziphus jujuba var. spinosa]